MNPVAEEIDILMHYGMPRRSGRYPWGSGDNPYQRTRDFLGRVEELKKQGWTETPENIKKEFGLTTGQYRMEKKLAKDERRMLQVETAKRLRDKEGMGPTEIGREMGINESTVRSLLNAKSESRMLQARETADFIRQQIKEKGMIDVGTSVEKELNISKEMLNTALYILEKEGYPIYKGGVPQVTNPGQQTNQKVICPPGTPHSAIYDYENVHTLKDYISYDDGASFRKAFVYPESMDSKRLDICYAEQGGLEKDGIIEIRRGVKDLSLGESRYAQVRILVDNDRYLKGMAVYADDLPDGIDVRFNTNKKSDVPMRDVLKKIKDDPDNPFGSAIKEHGGQSYYDDPNGKYTDPVTGKKQSLSLINKRADQGDWDDWKDALPSQFLSKQSKYMAQKQLNLAKTNKLEEYDEICSLTNPTVKKHLLQKFADECDSAAVHLQAAALPGQKYHVIVPVSSLKDTEVYAPNYESGTKLALIRYPHGGTFEIPILTVNNKNATAKKLIGTDSIDAVCINSKVAERLSGADFDGDTVMCIPTHDKKGRVKITSTDYLEGLVGFEPKIEYGYDKKTVDNDGTEHYYRNGKEFRKMNNTQTEMGKISNLITDMTLGGAVPEELAAAVRHSMVVIDAEKHKLDYKQSEIDNDIASLKKKYQAHVDENGRVRYGGASTIISRASGEYSVTKRQGTPKTNIKGKEWYDPDKPEGSLIYKTADDATYQYNKVNKRTGEVTVVTKTKKQKSTRMAETDDAMTLVSEAKHPMEIVYADYANSMKALANQARIEVVNTGKIQYSASAKTTYQAEVSSLMTKLNNAELNAIRERAALRKANVEVNSKKKAAEAQGSKMKTSDVKKASQQAITKYRQEVGSVSRKDRSIKLTDREWEAIQAGAVSENTLKRILNNTDIDDLRERATPKTTKTLSQAKINTIKAMRESNYTLEQISKKLGIPTSTVSYYLKGVN